MSTERYPAETVDPDYDDGRMSENVGELAEKVIGHRIISIEENADLPDDDTSFHYRSSGTALTLDNGDRVFLINTDDCCAFTEVQNIIRHRRHDRGVHSFGTSTPTLETSVMTWSIWSSARA